MEVIAQLAIALLAIGLSVTTHYGFLTKLSTLVSSGTLSKYARLLVVMFGITFSQLLCALWFAFGIEASIYFGLGDFDPPSSGAFIETYYFSMINLTTLGLSELTPTGHLSFLSGLEAMTGFLLVSCSASLIFKTMNK